MLEVFLVHQVAVSGNNIQKVLLKLLWDNDKNKTKKVIYNLLAAQKRSYLSDRVTKTNLASNNTL